MSVVSYVLKRPYTVVWTNISHSRPSVGHKLLFSLHLPAR
jgi:hypothetical protein